MRQSVRKCIERAMPSQEVRTIRPATPSRGSVELGLSSWQPPGADMFWRGLWRLQHKRAGIGSGSVVFLGQFSLDRGDLLLRLGERGRRAADLRDEFLKGSAVHCCPI